MSEKFSDYHRGLKLKKTSPMRTRLRQRYASKEMMTGFRVRNEGSDDSSDIPFEVEVKKPMVQGSPVDSSKYRVKIQTPLELMSPQKPICPSPIKARERVEPAIINGSPVPVRRRRHRMRAEPHSGEDDIAIHPPESAATPRNQNRPQRGRTHSEYNVRNSYDFMERPPSDRTPTKKSVIEQKIDGNTVDMTQYLDDYSDQEYDTVPEVGFSSCAYILKRDEQRVWYGGGRTHYQLDCNTKPLLHSKLRAGSNVINVASGNEMHFSAHEFLGSIEIVGDEYIVHQTSTTGPVLLRITVKPDDVLTKNVVLKFNHVDPRLDSELHNVLKKEDQQYSVGDRKLVPSVKNMILSNSNGEQKICVRKIDRNTLAIDCSPKIGDLNVFAIGVAAFHRS